MTHQLDSEAIEQVVEVLTEDGPDEIVRASVILMDEAMTVKRSRFLGVARPRPTRCGRGLAAGPNAVQSGSSQPRRACALCVWWQQLARPGSGRRESGGSRLFIC